MQNISTIIFHEFLETVSEIFVKHIIFTSLMSLTYVAQHIPQCLKMIFCFVGGTCMSLLFT